MYDADVALVRIGLALQPLEWTVEWLLDAFGVKELLLEGQVIVEEERERVSMLYVHWFHITCQTKQATSVVDEQSHENAMAASFFELMIELIFERPSPALLEKVCCIYVYSGETKRRGERASGDGEE